MTKKKSNKIISVIVILSLWKSPVFTGGLCITYLKIRFWRSVSYVKEQSKKDKSVKIKSQVSWL
jgi:hypothetical protein